MRMVQDNLQHLKGGGVSLVEEEKERKLALGLERLDWDFNYGSLTSVLLIKVAWLRLSVWPRVFRSGSMSFECVGAWETE